MKESRSKAQKLQKFKPKIYDLNILKHSQTLSNKNSLLHSKNKLPSASNETSNSSNSHQHPHNTIQTERFSNGKKSSSSSSSILSFLSNLSKGKKNPRIFNPPNARQKVHDSARLASKLRKKNTVSKNGLQTHVCRGEVRSDRSTLTRIYRATNFQGGGRDARWRDGIRLDTFPPLPDSPSLRAPGIVILSVGWTELTDLAGTRVQLRRFPPGI